MAVKNWLISDVCPPGNGKADATVAGKERALLARIADVLGEDAGSWRPGSDAERGCGTAEGCGGCAESGSCSTQKSGCGSGGCSAC